MGAVWWPLLFRYLAEMADLKTENNGSFKNGNPGGPGRPAGLPNKLTKTVKETVLAVFQEIQDDPELSLRAFAEKHPRDFYQIAAKLIPTDIQADIRTLVQVEQIVGMKIKDVVTS